MLAKLNHKNCVTFGKKETYSATSVKTPRHYWPDVVEPRLWLICLLPRCARLPCRLWKRIWFPPAFPASVPWRGACYGECRHRLLFLLT